MNVMQYIYILHIYVLSTGFFLILSTVILSTGFHILEKVFYSK